MVTDDLLDRLEAAYQNWHDSKGADPNVWIDLIGEQMSLRSVGHESGGLSFAKSRRSKAEMLEYLASLHRDWQMEYWFPKTFVRDMSQVAVFGQCKFVFRGTGKAAEVMSVHFWRFRDGKAVELVEVFDTARAVLATKPDL